MKRRKSLRPIREFRVPKTKDSVLEKALTLHPFQAPNANAYAQRWLRTVWEKCPEHILIIRAAHLRRVLLEFAQYYNAAHPHQGIEQQMPIPSKTSTRTGTIQRRKVLGGIINDYYRSSDSHVLAALA